MSIVHGGSSSNPYLICEVSYLIFPSIATVTFLPRILIPYNIARLYYLTVIECKSVPKLFVPSNVIHPNAVAPCIQNCASSIPLKIHSSSESTSLSVLTQRGESFACWRSCQPSHF